MTGNRAVHANWRDIGALALILTQGALVIAAGTGRSSRDRVNTANTSQVSASAQASRINIWEGVYTPAQAARGQKTYERACSACHGVDLKGGTEGAPALSGASFLNRYQDRPISELFQKIEETMPQDAPGSYDSQTYIDVISFILKKQLVPAGDTELKPNAEVLKEILITERR